jgi:hypothetical protein
LSATGLVAPSLSGRRAFRLAAVSADFASACKPDALRQRTLQHVTPFNILYGRGAGVGRFLEIGVILGIGAAVGVGVAVAVAVAVGVAAGVTVAVGVGLGVGPD